MAHVRATRFCAETKGKSQSIDLVVVDTESGDEVMMSYEAFKSIFGQSMMNGKEVCFEVRTNQIKESECEVPR